MQEEKNIECVPGQYFIQGGNDSEEKKACQFKRSLLQNCSGIEDPTFGYSKGQPCILLKMNRVQRKPLGLITSLKTTQGLKFLHLSVPGKKGTRIPKPAGHIC